MQRPATRGPSSTRAPFVSTVHTAQGYSILPHYTAPDHRLLKTLSAVRTMHVTRVDRRFGWDCHGLCPEVRPNVARHLRQDRHLCLGVDKFNQACPRVRAAATPADWA